MRLVTFEPAPGCQRLGALLSGKVVDLALAGDAYQETTHAETPPLPSDMMSFLSQGDVALSAARQVIDWAGNLLHTTGTVTSVSGDLISYELDRVRLRAPVPRPSRILCLALNYKAHAQEAQVTTPEKPYVFMKPAVWPVVGPNDKVFRPPQSEGFVWEGELGVIIGKRCRYVPRANAYEVIAGYTAVNDMSARDLGRTSVSTLFDWFQVKAFDTSLPMGPCLVSKDEIQDPHSLRLVVRVNGQVVQDASTGEMNFKIPELIEFITDFVTLEPGDVIATGTPGGSKGTLKAGDRVEVEIEDIGLLPSIIANRGD